MYPANVDNLCPPRQLPCRRAGIAGCEKTEPATNVHHLPTRDLSPLNLLYDLSLLGFCRDDPAKITGMPRVLIEQGARLGGIPECDPAFCASEDAPEAFAFARRHPAFAAGRFVDLDAPAGLAGADVFHTPHSAVPDAARTHRRLAVVQTIYDMIPFLLPETMTAEYRDYYADIVRRLRPEDHVVTISQHAKDDFCGYVAGFPAERVHVAPLAANRELFYPCADPGRIAAVRVKYALGEGPYLLSVCTFEPRKNLAHVIRAFVALAGGGQPGTEDLRLVLAGGKGWMFEPILAELAGTAGLRERIVTTGYVDDADLAPLYSGALGFLYLSRYEGFGLPPLEAMQCGAPVVASNASSLPEVVGDAGVLLDPDDQDGLCQAMLDLARDPTRRAAMSARSLERARLFSWEENVRQTAEVYRLAVAERRG